VIAAPNGTELARAGRGSEILYASLDPAMVRKAQLRLPYLLDRTSLDLLL
jgi:predicted amidohydrolase